ncbi:hypothetical protein SPRG_05356 [Saprolegnia parasitica CBS 223.65]|uniref:Major facilitator superfamily (MFS) profile domain-containing protein n=1 Tax=Saprolegnia parasitica (strain CBS 223.65) TaxID=695850 RepID=A0A067CHF6_SAPPC|nr:hypothetical protein SPRG_05356 [Saprolegnia parasitica CBS 223.65]KDO30164.1 hypothetical protein SPRG_05356 [Saprolegnia parasitica CBS 223.65]|eukprot:XP_012199342.1 hypothetical protein SPRG_05356 [Saprolegnia parasitica CBS 223.65]
MSSTSSTLALLHANIFVYAFAFWVTQPTLPFLLKELSADMLLFSRFQTFCSFLQLFGGPLAGRICDAFGFTPTLVLSQAAAALSYALLATTTSVPMLFLSQLPTVFMHAMHAAQSAMTVLCDTNQRAVAMGRLSLSYGGGMVVGSYVGGVVAEAYSNQHAAGLAALLSLAIIPLTIVLLPRRPATPAKATTASPDTSMHLGKILLILREPSVLHLVVVQLLLGLAVAIYRSTFSEVLRDQLQLGRQDIGLVMSLSGATSIVSNGLLLQLCTSRWADATVVDSAAVVMATTFLAYGHIPVTPEGLVYVLAVVTPMTAASSIAYTLLSSQMSRAVDDRDRATALGISHAVRSFCGLLAPTIGSFLFHTYAVQVLSVTCATISGLAIVAGTFFRTTYYPKPSVKRD